MKTYQFLSISMDQCVMAEWIVKQLKDKGQLEDEESIHIFFTGLLTNRLEQAEIYFYKELDPSEQGFVQVIYEEILH